MNGKRESGKSELAVQHNDDDDDDDIYIYIYIYIYLPIGIMIRFTYDLGDQGSIPGQVIPKTKKMVLDGSLLNTQHYKSK